MNNTETDIEDYIKIKEALEQLKITNNYLNEIKREEESSTRMLQVKDKVRGRDSVFKNIFFNEF